MTACRRFTRGLAAAALFLLSASVQAAQAAPPSAPKSTPAAAAASASTVAQLPPVLVRNYLELLNESQKERRGVTFYVGGQVISGIVSRVVGDDLVEVRNSTYTRILIRLDRVDAMATN